MDSHPAVRLGVRTFLQSQGVAVVGEADTLTKARRLLLSTRATVVITEAKLADGSGVELAGTEAGDAAVVVFTALLYPAAVRSVLAAGVRGLVRKEAELEELLDAVRTTAAGNIYLDPVLAAHLVGSGPTPPLRERDRSPSRCAWV